MGCCWAIVTCHLTCNARVLRFDLILLLPVGHHRPYSCHFPQLCLILCPYNPVSVTCLWSVMSCWVVPGVDVTLILKNLTRYIDLTGITWRRGRTSFHYPAILYFLSSQWRSTQTHVCAMSLDYVFFRLNFHRSAWWHVINKKLAIICSFQALFWLDLRAQHRLKVKGH